MSSYQKLLTHLPFRLIWLLIVFFSFLLVFITLEYFSFRTDINFLLAKQGFIHDWVWMGAFYLHITASILCLLSGPWQFIDYFRRRFTSWHRFIGKIYIFSILGIAAPSGFYMALYANGGGLTQLGFAVLSILWVLSTFQAYQSIRNKNIKRHRNWMIRSYALTLSAITLRLWMPILSLYTHLDHDFIIIITAWINWIPNLVIGELLIIFFPKNL